MCRSAFCNVKPPSNNPALSVALSHICSYCLISLYWLLQRLLSFWCGLCLPVVHVVRNSSRRNAFCGWTLFMDVQSVAIEIWGRCAISSKRLVVLFWCSPDNTPINNGHPIGKPHRLTPAHLYVNVTCSGKVMCKKISSAQCSTRIQSCAYSCCEEFIAIINRVACSWCVNNQSLSLNLNAIVIALINIWPVGDVPAQQSWHSHFIKSSPALKIA